MDQQQIIKEYFESIDPKLQQLIISPDTTSKIDQIIQKYPLQEEQGGQLKNEINLVLLGMEMFSDFRSNLVNELGITYDQALKLAFDVNDQIFSGVMNELKDMESDTIAAKNGEGVEEEVVDEENIPVETEPTPPKEENILQKQTQITPTPSASPKNISSDRMIPDHQAMEITDGPHLHSQTIMPQGGQSGLGTIIDQKLSRIVRNRAESEDISKKRGEKYRGSDPYREPIQ